MGTVECMAFSSDGRFLGVSTADGLLTIYDWHSGQPLNVLRSASAFMLYVEAPCTCMLRHTVLLAPAVIKGAS